MSDSPQDFDLKFLPDWLKEAPSTNRYADYEGDTGDRPRRGRDDRGGPPRGDRPPDRRGPRPGQGDRRPGPGGNRPSGDRPRGNAPRGDRRGEQQRPSDQRRDFRGGQDAPRPAPMVAPAELRIDFLPEKNAASGIARQIRTSNRAYPVFGTAKLFLERPERHRVRVSSQKSEVALFQVGDGPISFDRATVERGAFLHSKDEYYLEQAVEGEPIKGNFSNVARCRSTGTLIGPTNHHSYQPGLRKLFEERFSRRMSFQEFQQHEIEVITGEQAVADWKEQARTTVTYITTKEAEPLTFKSLAEAEQHFRKTYLPQLVKSGTSLECDGPASRAALDRYVNQAVRAAWEQERLFPQGLVNALRSYFNEAGLQFFKHRKRVLYVGAIKPLPHAKDQPFSDSITGILRTIEERPRIKRPELANKILGAGHESPEAAARKAQLASDVHYLVQMGHVIEFSDGSLDLALTPKMEQAPQQKASGKKEATSVDQPAAEAAQPDTSMGNEAASSEVEAAAPEAADPEQAVEQSEPAESPESPEKAVEEKAGSPVVPEDPVTPASEPPSGELPDGELPGAENLSDLEGSPAEAPEIQPVPDPDERANSTPI
ncbi:MAG TPA: hypothetical protein VF593_06570 [Chthoniobacteraceae bacterium]|jgi:hypothetical protein